MQSNQKGSQTVSTRRSLSICNENYPFKYAFQKEPINRLCFALLSWYVFSHCLFILCLILDECFFLRLLTKTISGNENIFEISQAVDVLNGLIMPSRFECSVKTAVNSYMYCLTYGAYSSKENCQII